MLHYTTIHPATLELLKKLMSLQQLLQMRLVGGTSLALQLGHRNSVDIDLFGKLEVEEFDLRQQLNRLGELKIIKNSPNIHTYIINTIKVDVVNFTYPWIKEEIFEDGLRLAGKQDIAAMKLSAITRRGSKKDFIDLYFLLKEFDIKEMIGFYLEKFHDGSEFLVLKSLTYFANAENQEMPLMFKNVFWQEVKESITQAVKKIFGSEELNILPEIQGNGFVKFLNC
jgi:hypothetical protein